MKDETKSFVITTQVVAEIHHHHHQQLNESSDIKDVINELENECTKKLKEMNLVTTQIPTITKTPGDPDLSPDLIVESSEVADDKSLWEDDGWSSSVDEIETDCSDLTSYRTDSYSSGESSDARSPAPGPLSPSSSTHRRRSVSLPDECCGVVEESVGGPVHNCDGGCNAFNMSMRGGGGGCGGLIGHGYGHGHGVSGPRGFGSCDVPKTYSASMGCTSHGSYVRYDRPSQVPYNRNPKTAGLNFNTNLRKPPENWLRMRAAAGGSGGWGRHGAPYWSYPYSKQSSWSMFAYRYIGRGRRPFHKGLANNLVCLCCGCCNCSRVNQTCCCCCYHCVHRISACRRPDLTKINRPLGAGPMGPGGPRKSVSNSLQQVGGSEGEASGSGQCGQNGNGQGGGEPESGLESGMDSGTESTSGKTSERSKKKSSSGGSGKSSTTTPSNETMPKSYKL